MSETRSIRKVVKARPTMEGAGVHLHRAIGFSQPELTDPFLLLDDFRSDTPADYLNGFPWHPHRGIETITYVLAGDVEHGDSMGNTGVISAGDVQWMTAGSGIVHQEMPKGDSQGKLQGFQLWANLPASHKMMDPRYQGVTAAEIPEVIDAGDNRIKVICGELEGVRGPVQDIITEPAYLDVTVPPGGSFSRATPRGHTVFAYVIRGKGCFGCQEDPYAYQAEGANYFDISREGLIGDQQLVLFGDGDVMTAHGAEEGVRFLLISGRPIGEPVAWYGPIVMNTQQELQEAYAELRAGTFVKSQG